MGPPLTRVSNLYRLGATPLPSVPLGIVTATEYREIYETCRELVLSRMTVAAFYAAVRDQGISRLTAAMLLRDFYGLNLEQCISVEESHGHGRVLDPSLANLVSPLGDVPDEPASGPLSLCPS